MSGAVPADSVLRLAANDQVAAHFGRLRFPTVVRYRTPQDSILRWPCLDSRQRSEGAWRAALGSMR